MMKNRQVAQLSEEQLLQMWQSIDFQTAEEWLLRKQQRLTKAVFHQEEEQIVRLQSDILKSRHAGALAVRHVTNTSNHIHGEWIRGAQKMGYVLELEKGIYRTSPNKCIRQTDRKGKERVIQIAPLCERICQKLHTYALAPIAEATGDRKSFAFRKGRSHMDADAYIREALSGKGAPSHVLIADVRACYESIRHDWLMRHIPMEPNMLRHFLTTSYQLDDKIYHPSKGIVLGSSLSGIIGNMTLDGLQSYLYKRLYRGGPIDYLGGNLIRFADDMVITARSKNQAREIRGLVADFLKARGLQLHSRKTKIVLAKEGFEFLSHHYQVFGETVFVTPAKEAVERTIKELQQYIEDYTGTKSRLIAAINQKLNGFATYHRMTYAKEVFLEIDEAVTESLFRLSEKQHPTWSRRQIVEHIFYVDRYNRYRYAMPYELRMQVKRLEDVPFALHKRVGTKFNPYLDREYLEERERVRDMRNVNGPYRAIWDRQEGKCTICHKPILGDQYKEVRTATSESRGKYTDMEYVHTRCRMNTIDK